MNSLKLKEYKHGEISLPEFLDLIDDEPCYKLLSIDGVEKGFKYKVGLNVDTNEFNPSETCCKGGLYFFVGNQILYYKNFTNNPFYIAKVDMSKLLGDETVRVCMEM